MQNYRETSYKRGYESHPGTKTERENRVCKELKVRVSLMGRKKVGWPGLVREGGRTVTVRGVFGQP